MQLSQNGGGLDFLYDEPDLYTIADGELMQWIKYQYCFMYILIYAIAFILNEKQNKHKQMRANLWER